MIFCGRPKALSNDQKRIKVQMKKKSPYFYQYPEYYDILFGWDRSQEILFVDALANIHGNHGKKFLEVACGTGTVSRNMALLGWDVFGLDLSEAMVSAMNREMSKLKKKNWAICADMRDFKTEQRFDLAYCALGSIGLLQSDEDLIRHFKCMKKHLAEGGIYCVDVGLQMSSKARSAPCDLESLVWAMEVEGIYVEASHGKVRVEDDMKQEPFELIWDAVPLEFNYAHFVELFKAAGLSCLEEYPQFGTTEEGIPKFNLAQKGYKEGQDRLMMVLG